MDKQNSILLRALKMVAVARLLRRFHVAVDVVETVQNRQL